MSAERKKKTSPFFLFAGKNFCKLKFEKNFEGGKKMFGKKILLSLCSAMILFFASIGLAEVQMYDGVGKYVMSDFEDQEIAKQRARVRAEQAAKDKAGVYLTNFSRVENFNLAANEISAITNNITNVVGEVKYESSVAEVDGMPVVIWTATLQANIDTDGIKNYLDRDDKEKITIVQQNESLQKDRIENDKKVEELKKRTAKATDAEKSELEKEFAQVDKEFLIQQKLDEGNKFYYQRNYAAALNALNEVIKMDPFSDSAYIRRSYVYQDLGKFDLAVADISKAIEINPQAYYYQRRGFIYKNFRNYEKAIADFQRMIELEPQGLSGYHGLAMIYRELKQNEKAIQEFTKTIAMNSNDIFAYSCRAKLYENQKQYEEAIADYTKIIELSTSSDERFSDRVKAYRGRAELYVKINDYANAMKDLTECIRIEKSDVSKAEAYDNRADFYKYKIGITSKANADYKKAIEFFTKAMASAKDKDTLLHLEHTRANLYVQIEDYKNAIADYTKIIDIKPQDYLTYERRADVYKELKQYDKAISDYLRCIELMPGDAYRYDPLGKLYVELKQYDKAIGIHNKRIKINPTQVLGYVYRGDTYIEMEEYKKAISDYSKAIELDSSSANYYYVRGQCYLALEKYEQAQTDFAKAKELGWRF